jgi:hypothetical protein
MANRRLMSLVGAGIVGLGLPLLAAEPTQMSGGSEATAIHGTLMTRKSDVGAWVPSSGNERASGKWYRTAPGAEAVVSFSSDVQVRMAPDTVFHVTSSTPSSLDLRVETGKILASVPVDGKTTVKVDSHAGDVHSSAGTFVVSVAEGQTKMEVMDGTARLFAPDAYCPALHGAADASRYLPAGFVAYAGHKATLRAPLQLAAVGEGDLAADGPDTRRRPQNEVRNEQTAPTNAGEDVPTMSPTVTETPAFTPEPTFSPTFTPPPSPSPPPVEQGAVIEEGGFPFEALIGAAGLGGLIYVLLQDDDDDDGGIIIPASP